MSILFANRSRLIFFTKYDITLKFHLFDFIPVNLGKNSRNEPLSTLIPYISKLLGNEKFTALEKLYNHK